jgi:hypothetical protein
VAGDGEKRAEKALRKHRGFFAKNWANEEEIAAMQCGLVYGIVPRDRSIADRAMEIIELELWRKRYQR